MTFGSGESHQGRDELMQPQDPRQLAQNWTTLVLRALAPAILRQTVQQTTP
jgi:hypothetical protein